MGKLRVYKEEDNSDDYITAEDINGVHRFLFGLLILLSVVYLSLSALCLIIVRNVSVTLI